MLLLLLLALISTSVAAQGAPGGATSYGRESFVLSGTVVNSVTGEPISRALVRTNGLASRSAFTDSEGHFQFEDMPPGQVVLTAQKPGYFSEMDSGGYSLHPIEIGPNSGAQLVKLVPQAAIYGRVLDASGQPIERIPVRLTGRSLREGRRQWEQRGMFETDEDGHFRFANLNPGTYYLAVGPADPEGRILAAGEKPTTGFPHLYFPGVPDLASAAPIQLSAGQQMQADFSVAAVPVYRVSGSVSGQGADRGVAVTVFTSSGDELSLTSRFNTQLGSFSLDKVPAGSYILRAFSNVNQQRLEAEQRINVASNVENVHLALAPAISIAVVAHMQSRTSSSAGSTSPNPGAWSEDRPPLSVSLSPAQPNAPEAFSTIEQRGGHNVMLLQNINPGNYSVNLMPQPPWYVQAATYGQTNVLYDDLTVAPGQSYPLDVVLRDDGASLTITVRGFENAVDHGAVVVIVPQRASKVRPYVLNGITNTYTATGLAPGEYLVYAFDRVDGLEYANPDVIAPYASQSAHVTVGPGQKQQVIVDPIHAEKTE